MSHMLAAVSHLNLQQLPAAVGPLAVPCGVQLCIMSNPCAAYTKQITFYTFSRRCCQGLPCRALRETVMCKLEHLGSQSGPCAMAGS